MALEGGDHLVQGRPGIIAIADQGIRADVAGDALRPQADTRRRQFFPWEKLAGIFLARGGDVAMTQHL